MPRTLSFRDERYLPFEGAEAVSDRSLELFSDLSSNNDFGKPLRQFDYETISDAILHVKYTARGRSGANLKDEVQDVILVLAYQWKLS